MKDANEAVLGFLFVCFSKWEKKKFQGNCSVGQGGDAGRGPAT